MIHLDKYEKQWILCIKGHLKEKYPLKGNFVQCLKPLFKDIYGWDPDEDNNYHDYLRGLFKKLLSIYLKIEDNQSGDPIHYISKIFEASFNKTISNDAELPIERAIIKLCGLIQSTSFLDHCGEPRYDLELFND